VVQPGLALVEWLAGVGLVVMQPDRDTGARIYQEHGVALLLGAVVGERAG
jgi:hypothetical protein